MKKAMLHSARLVGWWCIYLVWLVLVSDGQPPTYCLGLAISPSFLQRKRDGGGGGGANSSSSSSDSSDHHNEIIRQKTKHHHHHGQAVLLLHICSLTGKKEYEFGDLARWLDQLARNKAHELPGNLHHMYDHPSNSTSKSRSSAVSKTEQHWSPFRYNSFVKSYRRLHWLNQAKVVLLVWAVHVILEFNCEAIVLQYLPDMVLMEMVRLCLSNTAGIRARILRVVSTEMDHRIQSLFVDHHHHDHHHHDSYHLGGITRGTVQSVKLSKQALLKLTGQQKYVFGDISKQILQEALERHQRQQHDRHATGNINNNTGAALITQTLIQKQIDFINQMQENHHHHHPTTPRPRRKNQKQKLASSSSNKPRR